MTTGWAGMLALALAIGTASCGSKKPPGSEGLALGGADSGCLSRASRTFSRFLDGLATEAETGFAWDCASRSLTMFRDRTQGSKPGMYSPLELRAFLERYFLDGQKIADSLLSEAMVVKTLMVGGGERELSRAELDATIALLPRFKDLSLKLLPHMPLTPAAVVGAPKRTDAELDAAVIALREAADVLGRILQDNGRAYTFSHLDALLRALEAFQGKAASPLIAQTSERLGLVKAVKATLLASDPETIAGTEWARLFETGVRWYGLSLRAGGLDRYESWTSGPGRERLMTLSRELFELASEAVARHPGAVIPFKELDTLVDRASTEKGFRLPGDRWVPSAHLKALLRPLIQRWMAGSDTGLRARGALGLTRSALGRLLVSLERWNAGQRFLEAAFDAVSVRHKSHLDPVEYLPAWFKPHTLEFFQSQGALAPGPDVGKLSGQAILADAVARIRRIIAEERPLFRGQAHQIFFDGGPAPGRGHSFHNLSEANWMHEIARLLNAGYAVDPKRAGSSDDLALAVSFEEFKRFVLDIRDIGVDLKYIDPDDPLLAEKRFREGELFTFAGTGAQLLDVRQASQLLALMLSGKRLADQIHSAAVASGCRTLGMDPFGYENIDASCYRRFFFDHLNRFWGNMPSLLIFYRSLDAQKRKLFERWLEEGARKQGYGDKLMNSTDSEGFAMIGQYVEVVFSRFDKDSSGFLDQYEAQEAFPVFKDTLYEISCQAGSCLGSPVDLSAVFSFMLSQGFPPSTWQFVRWRYLRFSHPVWSDRGKLMRIFGGLSRPAPAAPPSEPSR